MKIKYSQDTDTLYIELRRGETNETKDLDKNILLDLDGDGQLCTITIGHASQRYWRLLRLPMNNSPLELQDLATDRQANIQD